MGVVAMPIKNFFYTKIYQSLLFFLLLTTACFAASAQPKKTEVLANMKKATRFMVEKVSYNGGYVWSYLPDFSRQWGELEAHRTMIWMQPPGTATMGHIFLDAYHATGDEYYYQAAERVAGAIIWAQHPSGGWNYVADFAGEMSLRDWYNTVGKNAWRLEEFQVYYGNATFDDGGTAEAAKFLLRLYSEKLDVKYRPALNKAIEFVLQSQYPIGGWPQRYPLRESHPYKDHQDYTSFITFNDDVAKENIDFLLMCNQVLGDGRFIEPVVRAMNAFLVMQSGQPQSGWALQYTVDLQPAGGRTYEPKSMSPDTTAKNILQLIKFYRMTGETKFLARIPEALAWLDKVRFPIAQIKNGRTHAGYVEVGTGNFLFTHRRGSNVINGEYYVDNNAEKTLAHYASARKIDVESLRAAYNAVLALSPDDVIRDSPLKTNKKFDLPEYFAVGPVNASDLNFRAQKNNYDENISHRAQALCKTLNAEGYWPTPIYFTSHPYKGEPSKVASCKNKLPIDGGSVPAALLDEYSETMVGDEWDTSPYPVKDPPLGISTGAYIRNMGVLIDYYNDLNAQQ
jgi:PelA/Pel-15E family pectate lyase